MLRCTCMPGRPPHDAWGIPTTLLLALPRTHAPALSTPTRFSPWPAAPLWANWQRLAQDCASAAREADQPRAADPWRARYELWRSSTCCASPPLAESPDVAAAGGRAGTVGLMSYGCRVGRREGRQGYAAKEVCTTSVNGPAMWVRGALLRRVCERGRVCFP